MSVLDFDNSRLKWYRTLVYFYYMIRLLTTVAAGIFYFAFGEILFLKHPLLSPEILIINVISIWTFSVG